MYILFYLLDVCIGFSPASSNEISPLSGTLEAPVMQSPTSHFSPLAILFEHTQNWIYTVSPASKDLAKV
jgi:hypothetical protein